MGSAKALADHAINKTQSDSHHAVEHDIAELGAIHGLVHQGHGGVEHVGPAGQPSVTDVLLVRLAVTGLQHKD